MKLLGLLIVMALSTACEQQFNLESLDKLTNSENKTDPKTVSPGHSSQNIDKSGAKQVSDNSGTVQGSNGQPTPEEEEKDSSGNVQASSSNADYILYLHDYGPNKITTIKEVRSLTGLGLQEAKALVESVPTEIFSFTSEEEAKKAASRFEAISVKAEIIKPKKQKYQSK